MIRQGKLPRYSTLHNIPSPFFPRAALHHIAAAFSLRGSNNARGPDFVRPSLSCSAEESETCSIRKWRGGKRGKKQKKGEKKKEEKEHGMQVSLSLYVVHACLDLIRLTRSLGTFPLGVTAYASAGG